MISVLAAPSVCVVDNEPEDYEPILLALNALYVSSIHIKGDDIGQLPEEPFSGLKLVFQDLHLTADTGKNAASHAANVFRKLVSTGTAPVVVVIWSKYSSDPVNEVGEQSTEADVFRTTLLDAVPEFSERLIFVEMQKKKPADRPAGSAWIEEIKAEIANTLNGKESVAALWQWEMLVQRAGIGICKEVTSLAYEAATATHTTLQEGLKAAMQSVAKAQSIGDFSAETAPRQLTSALSQLLLDYLESPSGAAELHEHGIWLAQEPNVEVKGALRPKLNGLLLTANLAKGNFPFSPGVVYKVLESGAFEAALGRSQASLIADCYGGNPGQCANWQQGVKPVLIEISATCDVAQGNRHRALVIGGLIVPAELSKHAKNKDAWHTVPAFTLRWGKSDFGSQDASLVFCSRYRATLPADAVPEWLDPWFRLRDLPTSALRNWHSAMASRVGYLLV